MKNTTFHYEDTLKTQYQFFEIKLWKCQGWIDIFKKRERERKELKEKKKRKSL